MKHLQPDTLIHNPIGTRVTSTVDLPADPRSVWKIVGDFAGFSAFIPALSLTEMTGEGIGSVRKKLFKDGNVVIEQLNSRDDSQLCMTWTLIHTSLPVGSLWAAMHVEDLPQDNSRAVWTIVAEPSALYLADLPGFEGFLQGFADGAMANVKTLFS